jgi:L-malate glycosyltransferase
MNIGIVLYPTFGGSGVVATELGKALAEKGNQVHFITYSQPVRLDFVSANVFYHEVSVNDYPLFQYPPYELALASTIVDVARNHGLDVLHAHYAIPHAYAAHMAKMILREEGIQLPVVTTLHGTDITLVGRHPSYLPAVTFSINQSDAVTSVSESLRKDTFSYFEIKKPISVIPNFIDFDLYKDKGPCLRHLFAPNNERIVVHVSNFRKVKRIPDVIHIFEKLSQEIPAVLLMLGEGPEREKAERQVRELCLADKVKFLGKTNDVVRALYLSDLFLLPSETESFGLAALEAMACHVPVVASNTGGIPEVIQEGKSGYMCNVGDVDGMAKAAIHILHDDQTLNAFKERAYTRALEFDVKNILPLYEQVYAEVIENAKVALR